MQYSEMECNCVKKITEGLFRKYSISMKAYVWKSNNSVNNIIHLGRRPPKFWGPRLQPIEPIGKFGLSHVVRISQDMSSPPNSCEVRVAQSLIFSKCFVDNCLSFCPFLGHFIVCPSLIYCFLVALLVSSNVFLSHAPTQTS